MKVIGRVTTFVPFQFVLIANGSKLLLNSSLYFGILKLNFGAETVELPFDTSILNSVRVDI